MRDSILNFAKQFEFEPVIQNDERFRGYRRFRKFIICGMGGSHFAADFIRQIADERRSKMQIVADILIHSDYGLPEISDLKDRLVIVSSYSGNTEEEVDNFNEARRRKLPVAVIASGGRLVSLAREHRIPFIQLLGGVQPRMAIGYSLLGLLKLMGEKHLIKEYQKLGLKLEPAKFERGGRNLAKKLVGKIPVVYSSTQNKALAYYWKIMLNETGKVPAFYNVFPELNHNEMQGFDAYNLGDESNRLSTRLFTFIFLLDKTDHPRIQKRMRILQTMLAKTHLSVEIIQQSGATAFQKIFNSMFLVIWTAYHLAKSYRLKAEQVPLIEEFKKRIK